MLLPDRYPIPAGEARTEMEVHRSRFIASAGPASTVDAAKQFIRRIRDEFPDATHHVPAYLIGHGSSVVAHCGDAGEPPGTAGRPALAVLRASGLGDVVVVVTRYFGGTKLGTGGLVRAYGDAVRQVLEALPRAEKVAVYICRITVPYGRYAPLRLLVAAHRGRILEEAFAADVELTMQLAVAEFPSFQEALRASSDGALRAEIIETAVAAIQP